MCCCWPPGAPAAATSFAETVGVKSPEVTTADWLTFYCAFMPASIDPRLKPMRFPPAALFAAAPWV